MKKPIKMLPVKLYRTTTPTFRPHKFDRGLLLTMKLMNQWFLVVKLK